MNDVENVRVEQRGPAVRCAMPKSQRQIEQQWKSNAVAAEELPVECREDPRSSWLIDEYEPQPVDGPLHPHVVFYRGFVLRWMVLRPAGAQDGQVVPSSKVCHKVPANGAFGALSRRKLVSTHKYLEALSTHAIVSCADLQNVN